MNKLTKILKIIKIAPLTTTMVLLIIISLVVKIVVFFTSEGAWKVDRDQLLRFEFRNGDVARNQFVKYFGSYYYVDENGCKVTLSWIDDNKRYIDARGKLVVSRYSYPSDQLAALYYFDDNGYLLEPGVRKINNYEVIVKDDGSIVNDGFCYLPNTTDKVFVGENGEIYKNKGLVDIDGETYIFDETGIIELNQWKNYKGKDYYLTKDGSIAKDTWVQDTYYVDKKGEMLKQTTAPDGSYLDEYGKIRFINNLKQLFKDKKVGDEVKLGFYFINDGNTKDDIVWQIVDIDGENAYLWSKNVIDVIPYDMRVEDKEDEDNSWEKSTLREWLNYEFKTEAFNMNTVNAIVNTKLVNEGNSTYGIEAENDTYDRIFILSNEELREYITKDIYFGMEELLKAYPTPYAYSKGLYTYEETNTYNDSCHYWIRNKGSNSKKAITCVYNGFLDINGYTKTDRKIGVRPFLILNYNKESEINTQ